MKLSNPYQRSSSLANFVNGIKQLFHQKPWHFLLYSLRPSAKQQLTVDDPIRTDFSTFPTHPTNDPRAPPLDLNVQSTPDSPRTARAIDPLGVSTAWTSPLPPTTSRGAPRGSISVAWARPTSPLQASERRAARSPRPEPSPPPPARPPPPRPAPGGRPSAESLDERVRCSSSAVAALRPRSSPPSHPPSSASRYLPRPPCAASGDCCPELPRSLRYPAPARVGRKEARRRPCPPAPNVRWGRELACAGTRSRVGKAGARGAVRKGRADEGCGWDGRGALASSCPPPERAVSRGRLRREWGPEFLADVGLRGLVQRRQREPRDQQGCCLGSFP